MPRVHTGRKHALPWTLVAAALVLSWPTPSQAGDTWTTPFPGVRLLHRTGASNLELHAAVIDLCAAGVSVRMTGFSERGKKTSTHAQAVGAQLAVNGDFYCRSVDVAASGSPYPPCVGKPVYRTWGLAAHAGEPWPEEIHRDALAAFGVGRAQVFDWAEHHPLSPWMQEALGGHFSLVLDGKVSTDARIQPAQCGRDPRTALGLSKDRNTLFLVVVDGRNAYRGANCLEVAQLLVELGADRGFNLDGGGSSTLWMQGRGIVNHPSDGAERTVGSHLAVFASGAGPSPHCDRGWTVDPAAPLPAVEPDGAPRPLGTGPAGTLDQALRSPVPDGGSGLVLTPVKPVPLGDGGHLPVLPAEASALALNLLATGGGQLELRPCTAAPVPDAGIPLPAGGTFGLSVLVPAEEEGVCVSAPPGVAVSADQFGHLAPGAGLLLQPVRPLVVMDTRAAGGRFRGRLPEARPVELPLSALPGLPMGTEAAALTLQVEDALRPGVLGVGPCTEADGGLPRWMAWWEGDAQRNTVIVPLAEGGVCLSASGEPHARVELAALFVTPPPRPTPPMDAGTPPLQDGGESGPANGAGVAMGGCGCAGSAGPAGFTWLAWVAWARARRPTRNGRPPR